MKKTIVILIYCVSTALVVGLGVYFVMESIGQNKIVELERRVGHLVEQLDNRAVEKLIDKESEREEIEEKIDTSNWQVYRNEEYEFEIKYPNNWYFVIPEPTQGFSVASFSDSEKYLDSESFRNDYNSENSQTGLISFVPMAPPEEKGMDEYYLELCFGECPEKIYPKEYIKLAIDEGTEAIREYWQEKRLWHTFLLQRDRMMDIVLNEPLDISERNRYKQIYDQMIYSFEFTR